MPKQISRVADEGDSDIYMGNPYESENYEFQDFVFPKNLKDMTWEQREELHKRHVRHYASRNTSDLSPSRVFEAGDADEAEAEIEVEENDEHIDPIYTGTRFDPEKGYIVDGEDVDLLISLGRLSEEEADKLRKSPRRARIVSHSEALDAKLARMSRLEREAEERFGNI